MWNICETWSLVLREERKLQNIVLKKTFTPQKNVKATSGWPCRQNGRLKE